MLHPVNSQHTSPMILKVLDKIKGWTVEVPIPVSHIGMLYSMISYQQSLCLLVLEQLKWWHAVSQSRPITRVYQYHYQLVCGASMLMYLNLQTRVQSSFSCFAALDFLFLLVFNDGLACLCSFNMIVLIYLDYLIFYVLRWGIFLVEHLFTLHICLYDKNLVSSLSFHSVWC